MTEAAAFEYFEYSKETAKHFTVFFKTLDILLCIRVRERERLELEEQEEK